jgi:hypothetical protein
VVTTVLFVVLATGADPFAAPPADHWMPPSVVAPHFPPDPGGSAGQPPAVMSPAAYPLSAVMPGMPPGGNEVERLPPALTSDPTQMATTEPLLDNYYDPFGNQFVIGRRVGQPYRLDWYSYEDFTYIPTSATRGTPGSFQDVQWNAWMRFGRTFRRYMLAWTPTWNSSWWTGPSGVALPPDADQIKSDFQLSSLNEGPWNWQIGFTPQINADFRRSLDSNAYMFDGRIVLFYQASDTLRLAMGGAYWNRVTSMIIPYGGVLWTPDAGNFACFSPRPASAAIWAR